MSTDKWPINKIQDGRRWLANPGEWRFEAIVRLLKDKPHKWGGEIGVREGETTLHLLKNLPGMERLYVIDPWRTNPPSVKHPRAAFMRFWDAIEPYMDRLVILRKFSDDAKRDIAPGGLDFCFIDGNHHYPQVCRDIELAKLWVRDGGLIIGHDYISRMKNWNVKRAVDEAFGDAVELAGDRTWYVWKGAPAAAPAEIAPEKPADARRKALWWCNGGVGDACMMAAGVKALADSGFAVDFYPQRRAPRLAGELLGMLPGVTCLPTNPRPSGPYDVACCDCDGGTLKKRTDGIECGMLVTPQDRSGTPREWAIDIARRAGADSNALNNSKRAVFAGLLPHERTPKVIVFGTGVGGTTDVNKEKWWPEGKWDELQDALCSVAPIFWVGSDDAYCPESVLAERHLVGKTRSLAELLPIFAEAALYVGVDNGLGHMAAACGVPTLTIFGATDPARFHPWGHMAMTLGEKGRFPTVAEVAETARDFMGVLTC